MKEEEERESERQNPTTNSKSNIPRFDFFFFAMFLNSFLILLVHIRLVLLLIRHFLNEADYVTFYQIFAKIFHFESNHADSDSDDIKKSRFRSSWKFPDLRCSS